MSGAKGVKEKIEEAPRSIREDRDARTLLGKRLLQVEIDSKKQEQRLQKRFAYWAVGLVSGWLVFVAVLLVLVGISKISLSNTVLATLLATTTVNVIALSMVMAKGLFPNK